MFYVYVYLRLDGTPYYVGKGKGKRAWVSQRVTPKPTDNSRIVIVESALNEDEAFRKEKELIAKWGRKDLGTGILHNRTDGGDGTSGYQFSNTDKSKISEALKGKKRSPFTEETISRMCEAQAGRKVSQETREKISTKAKGRKQSPETIAKRVEKNTGKTRTLEFCRLNGLRHKGKVVSEATRQKLSLTLAMKEKILCPQCGKLIGGQANFNRWHGDNCKTILDGVERSALKIQIKRKQIK